MTSQNLSFNQIICKRMAFASFDSLPDSSRVWVYRSSRPFSAEEEMNVNHWLQQFVDKWTAHNVTLLANAQVFHSQFIVITLDENSSTQASGCSIDSQVRFITQIGNQLNIDLFDRLTFDFEIEGKVVSIHKDEVRDLISKGQIKETSQVFDHLVKTKEALSNNWLVTLNQSWHNRLI